MECKSYGSLHEGSLLAFMFYIHHILQMFHASSVSVVTTALHYNHTSIIKLDLRNQSE